MQRQLRNVAHVRSGDKGNTACISVIAFSPELYELVRDQLSGAQFKAFYKGLITGDVTRYEAPRLTALQFVAEGALGGGVSRSLCLDNYGKALCSAILAYPIEVPERLQNQLRGL